MEHRQLRTVAPRDSQGNAASGSWITTRRVGHAFTVGGLFDVVILETQPNAVKLGVSATALSGQESGVPLNATGSGYFVSHKGRGTMLVLRRDQGTHIDISDNIRITVLEVSGERVRLACGCGSADEAIASCGPAAI